MMNSASAATAVTRSSPLAMGSQGSYRLSSDELRSGLDVRAVSLTELPVDLVRELLRLRKAWSHTADHAA